MVYEKPFKESFGHLFSEIVRITLLTSGHLFSEIVRITLLKFKLFLTAGSCVLHFFSNQEFNEFNDIEPEVVSYS